MSETDALSLAELERAGRVFGTGRERRALCPFCGDEHARDRAHACLAVNVDTGAWTCHRCGRSGLLTEHKTPRDSAADPLRPHRRGRRIARPQTPAPATPKPPTPEETAEAERRRETLRRLWGAAVPIDASEAAAGAAYLAGRGIPLDVAASARVRFAADWYGRPSVVFPVQDSAGHLVAAEGRYTDGGKTPKGRTCGPKSSGVFVALPGALEADGVTVCEGPITALSMAACGFPAVAIGGHNWPSWLPRRLAWRAVFVAFDEGETGSDAKAAELARAVAAVGAKPYRLRLAPGVDLNDYLQRYGLETTRAALTDAICAALAPA